MNKQSKKNEQPVVYVALGDSLSVGIGAIFKPGFVKRYAKMVERETGRKVIPFVFAKHGSTSRDVLKKLGQSVIRFTLRQADIITISAGGNDLRQAAKTYFINGDERVLKKALYQYKKNMGHILAEISAIKQKRKNKPYIIRLLDVYNPLYNRKDAHVWVERFQKQLNKFGRKNVAVTNIYEEFLGREKELLFIDKLHPNAEGYQVIAIELHRLGYGDLTRVKRS